MRSTAIATPSATLAALLLSFGAAPASHAADAAGWTPCKAPVEVATRAYRRVQQASAQPSLQHDLRLAFWDVHEFAHNCPELKVLAAELTRAGLARDSAPPKIRGSGGAEGTIAGFALPAGCMSGGTLTCNILVTKPGKGNTEGAERLDWYKLEAAAGKEPAFKYDWKAIDVHKLPTVKPLVFEKK